MSNKFRSSSTTVDASVSRIGLKSCSPTLPSIVSYTSLESLPSSCKHGTEGDDNQSGKCTPVTKGSARITSDDDHYVSVVGKSDDAVESVLPSEIEGESFKKSKSLTRKIKELSQSKAGSPKTADLNSVKAKLFPPREHEGMSRSSSHSVGNTVGLHADVSKDQLRESAGGAPSTTTATPLTAKPHCSIPGLTLGPHALESTSAGGQGCGASAIHSGTGKSAPKLASISPGVRVAPAASSSGSADMTGNSGPYRRRGSKTGVLSSLTDPAAAASVTGESPQQPFGKHKVFTLVGGDGGEAGAQGLLSAAGELDTAVVNDRLIHERLQEAKALSRRDERSGAVMHTFSLWGAPPRFTAVAADCSNPRAEQAAQYSAPHFLTTPTKVLTGQTSPGASAATQLLQTPSARSSKVRGPMAAISQLHAISAKIPGATTGIDAKESQRANKTRLCANIRQSVDVDVSGAGMGQSAEAQRTSDLLAVVGTAIVLATPSHSDGVVGAADGEDAAGAEEDCSDGDWSSYSSDFESATSATSATDALRDAEDDDAEVNNSAPRAMPCDAVPSLSGSGLQRGLASSLRSKVVDAKTSPANGTSTTSAEKFSLSLPVGGFGAAMSVVAMASRPEGSRGAGDLSTPVKNFSKSIDSASLSAQLRAGPEGSFGSAPDGGDDLASLAASIEEDEELRRHVAQSLAGDAGADQPVVHSRSMQALHARHRSRVPELAVETGNRGRSTSIGCTPVSVAQRLHQQQQLSSLTARPAGVTAPTQTTVAPIKGASNSGSSHQQPQGGSKYQTLRQLKLDGAAGAKLKKTSPRASGTGGRSALSDVVGVSSADPRGGQHVDGLDDDKENGGDGSSNREEGAESPALSELSDLDEELGAADGGARGDQLWSHQQQHQHHQQHTVDERIPSLVDGKRSLGHDHGDVRGTVTGIMSSGAAASSCLERSDVTQSKFGGGGGGSPIQWKKGEAIGEGTFGKVFKGLNEKTGELLAIKQLCIANGSEAEVGGLQREIQVMRDLHSEHIVRYLGTTRSERYLYIVLEFVTGGSIAGMLGQFGAFSESLIRRFTSHVATGVEYLHARGIVHRDIKGANILVTDNGVAKLADFGCSKQLAGMCTASMEESLRAIRGSVPWMAPEVIKQSGHGRAADIWSVGATVIEMATGKPPWPEFSNNLAALFHVATSKAPPPVPERLSPACAALIRRCLVIEPGDRANAQDLLRMEFLAGASDPKSDQNAAAPDIQS